MTHVAPSRGGPLRAPMLWSRSERRSSMLCSADVEFRDGALARRPRAWSRSRCPQGRRLRIMGEGSREDRPCRPASCQRSCEADRRAAAVQPEGVRREPSLRAAARSMRTMCSMKFRGRLWSGSLSLQRTINTLLGPNLPAAFFRHPARALLLRRSASELPGWHRWRRSMQELGGDLRSVCPEAGAGASSTARSRRGPSCLMRRRDRSRARRRARRDPGGLDHVRSRLAYKQRWGAASARIFMVHMLGTWTAPRASTRIAALLESNHLTDEEEAEADCPGWR